MILGTSPIAFGMSLYLLLLMKRLGESDENRLKTNGLEQTKGNFLNFFTKF